MPGNRGGEGSGTMTTEFVVMQPSAKERGQPLEKEEERNRFTSSTSR